MALKALHHPFTQPKFTEEMQEKPEQWLSKSYDLVCNGIELGGGSLRIHSLKQQSEIFQLLGITAEEANEKFGFLLEALKYGAPSMGGFAIGLDRLIMILAERDSIRDTITFPKTQRATCPLTDAPSEANLEQLRELNIRLRDKK